MRHKIEFERKYRRGQKTMIQTFHQVAANVSRCHILQSTDVFQPG
ncbi:hypothetical protein BACOVA_00472 [Bacteroides ovatus ATCC 8483]|uniref:Uncharacterized protein n=1 Tax=Bacteroides ovatus (strain ATCC 8483 / DSM 1896 / JCM 5824 / BCRC 10623 / CCUG 4943 / NCTC 11153) TaxID=411476 RepID=A0AAN3ACJ5_BACO1|nr:hypothetical protein BACOVA_00472 [Bacteroides ovatus ATCC 8483]